MKGKFVLDNKTHGSSVLHFLNFRPFRLEITSYLSAKRMISSLEIHGASKFAAMASAMIHSIAPICNVDSKANLEIQ